MAAVFDTPEELIMASMMQGNEHFRLLTSPLSRSNTGTFCFNSPGSFYDRQTSRRPPSGRLSMDMLLSGNLQRRESGMGDLDSLGLETVPEPASDSEDGPELCDRSPAPRSPAPAEAAVSPVPHLSHIEEDDLLFSECYSICMPSEIFSGIETPLLHRQQRASINYVYPTPAASPIIESMSDFCFPDGILYEIIPSNAVFRFIQDQKMSYHILQFSDSSGGVMYGACVTFYAPVPVTDQAMKNFKSVREASYAADVIKCFFMRLVLETQRGGVGLDRRLQPGNRSSKRQNSQDGDRDQKGSNYSSMLSRLKMSLIRRRTSDRHDIPSADAFNYESPCADADARTPSAGRTLSDCILGRERLNSKVLELLATSSTPFQGGKDGDSEASETSSTSTFSPSGFALPVTPVVHRDSLPQSAQQSASAKQESPVGDHDLQTPYHHSGDASPRDVLVVQKAFCIIGKKPMHKEYFEVLLEPIALMLLRIYFTCGIVLFRSCPI